MAQREVSWDPRVVRAMRHVERRIAEPDADLSLEAVAAVAGMSAFHFHRLFRAAVGEPLQAWARRLRLERAAALLAHSRWPVASVGMAAGYETQAAFTRAFSRRFGVPPAAWRASATRPAWLKQPGEGSRGVRGGVGVSTLPERQLVVVRHVGGLEALGGAVASLVALVEEHGWLDPDAWAVLIFHDDSEVVEADQWRIDVGWPVPAGTPAPAGAALHMLPRGDYAVCTAAGTTEELNEAFTRFLYEEIPASGLQPAAFESLVEVPGSYLWEATADLAGLLGRATVARALHAVGPAGALLREGGEED